MLDKIIYFSLHNRLVILFSAILLFIGGTYITLNTEVDVFPDLNAPTVVVMTEAQGMAPEEVEQLVTFPIETSVNGATGVRRVRSSSTTGFSVVWVEFDWGTDIYLARQIVSEKLATLGDELPDNIGQSILGPQSSILGEILIVSLTADTTSMLDLRTLADWTIRPRLLSTGGVAQVSVLGGDIKEYQIQVDPQRMKHHNVTLKDVLESTKGMNQNTNGGVLYEYGNEYIIRGILSTTASNQLEKSIVKRSDNQIVLLQDIASVKITGKTPKLGTASKNGKPAILLTVTKQPDTSTLHLTDKLDAAIADLSSNLPSDVKVSTDIFRQSHFIESSIGNVKNSLLEGGLFVVVVLFLFLANIRTTFISFVTLPLSIIISILTLHYMGLTINTMSLGGLAIAIGSLVDDAIVDVENVFRRLRENQQIPKENRQPILTVVYEASREVRMPILNSTLIIAASFFPLFFLSGMEGRMLVPLGVAFLVALFASTLIALTLTPVLCSYLLKPHKEKGTFAQESFIARVLKKQYKKALTWTLSHKKTALSITGGFFVMALLLFFTLGNSFLPSFNEGSLTINISSLPGISLEESDAIGQQAEEILLKIPEIKTVARKTGRAELDEHSLGINASEIEAPFELDQGRSRSEFTAHVREQLNDINGVIVEIGQPISHRIDAMLSGTQANIAIKLFGDNLNHLFTIGNDIKSTIQSIDGIIDLNVEQQIERPQLVIEPKRELLAAYGITLPEFSTFVSTALAGEVVSQVYEQGKTFDLTVKVAEEDRDRAETIKDLLIDTYDGKKVPLNQVAEVRSTMGPNTINRENVKRKIVVSANVMDRDLRGVVNDIQKAIDKNIQLPEGYHIEYGGQFESEQAASRVLLLTSFLALAVIFLLLYQQFKSSKEAGIILLNLPLALIGGVFAIFFTSGELSIPAIIGFISLFGIATRNGILLISHYNHLQQVDGLPIYESVIQGSLDRLNPILMTALTSALALVPLAFKGSLPGNEIQSPMAKVILGGLLTSTFLNGFIVPIVYLLIHRKEIEK